MRQHNRYRGQTISETGPALFVLFIIILFPLIDLFGLLMSYGTCWYINFVISNQVARSREAQVQTIINDVVGNTMQTSFATFLGLTANNVTVTPTFNDGASPPNVQIATTLTAKPFINIPWFSPAPGLNAPVTFTINSQLTRESTL